MSEQQVSTSKTAGTWLWLFQRVTAVLLIVLLGLHIYVTHFMDINPEEHITVAGVELRLDNFLYIVLDYSLLAVVLFHALNGARTVLLDFDMFYRRRKALDIGLVALGIVTMIWGIIVLFPFIGV
jgi:succinate dehydrogenase hydrophobic anchor subunit